MYRFLRKSETTSLIIPEHGNLPAGELCDGESRWLLAIENRLDDVGREQREIENPAHVGAVHFVRPGDLGDQVAFRDRAASIRATRPGRPCLPRTSCNLVLFGFRAWGNDPCEKQRNLTNN